MAETALIVCVPEAEPLVSSLRTRFDKTALLGVPAHITVLWPFMAPDEVSEEVLSKLHRLFATVAPFTFSLAGVGRFPETTYLAPNPAAPFQALTQTVFSEFPSYPPYKGEFKSVIPHLTVAHSNTSEAKLAELELSDLMARMQPVRAMCKSVMLIENLNVTWKEMQTFGLKG